MAGSQTKTKTCQQSNLFIASRLRIEEQIFLNIKMGCVQEIFNSLSH